MASILFRWRKAVASAAGPHPTTRHALLVLSLWMDDRGSCYPSIASISQASGLNERTARRRLEDAEDTGWLSRGRRGLAGQGWGYCYQAMIPKTLGSDQVTDSLPAPWSERPDSLPAVLDQGPDSRYEGPDSHDPRNGLSAQGSLQKSSKNSTCDWFEEAWKSYPIRPNNSKAAALRAWKAREKAGEDPSAMLAGAKRYAAYITAEKTEPRFVKQAATFFGPDRHYLNEYSTAATQGNPRNPLLMSQEEMRQQYG